MKKIYFATGLLLLLAAVVWAIPLGQHNGQNTAVDSIQWNTYTFNTLPTTTSAPWLATNPNAPGTRITCVDCTSTSPPAQGATLTVPIECRWTGSQWNCASGPLSPLDFGAKFDWQGYTTGTSVAGTTFTDTVKVATHPFVPADVGKTFIGYGTKQGANWTTNMSCPHGTVIQPLTNNPGNFVMWAVNRATGTAGGTVPAAFSQTNIGLTTDGTCTWETILFTGTPLITTIASYVSPTTITLTAAPTIAINGAVNYIYGTDDTTAIQNTVNSCSSTCEIDYPCSATAVTETDIIGRSVHVMGCGPGVLGGDANGPLGAGIIALGGGSAFYVQAGFGSWIDGHRIKGISSNPSVAGIQWFNGVVPTPTPTPGPNNGPRGGTLNELNRADNMYIGSPGPYSHEVDAFGEFQTGIDFTPVDNGANNGPFVLINNQIGSALQYELDLPNTQFLNNVFISTQIATSTLIAKGSIRVAPAQTLFQGLTVLTEGTWQSAIGDGVFDLKPGANVTVVGFAGEQDARLINCDMSGLSSMSATFRITNGYFQLGHLTPVPTGTASDNNVVNCGPGAIGGAANAFLQFTFNDFLFTNNAGTFPTTAGSWHVDVANTNTSLATLSKLEFNNVGGQGVPFTLSNISASTVGSSNRVQVAISNAFGDDIIASTNGTAALVQQHEINYPIMAHQYTSTQLGPPLLAVGCAVGVAGAATCRYQVTQSDNNGDSHPSLIKLCTSSAALGSQSNTFQFFITPGVTGYKVYGDDCNGSAINNLLQTISRPDAVFGTTGKSYSFVDAAIARAGGGPPAGLDRTGTMTQATYPDALGQVLVEGGTVGSATFANLPSYAHTVINNSATVYWHMDNAGGNETDVVNSNVATAAGGIVTAGSLIQDYLDPAVTLNGTTGTYSVAPGTGLCDGGSCSCVLNVKFTSLAGGNQFILGQKTNGFAFYKAGSNILVLAKQGAGNIIDGSTAGVIPDTATHQVGFSMTVSAGSTTAAQLYLDGDPAGTNYANQTQSPADSTLYIGSSTGVGSFLNATVDEVACAKATVWTPAQFNAIYVMGLQKKYYAKMYASDIGCSAEYNGTDWRAAYCGEFAVANLPTCNSTNRKYGWATVINNNAACDATGYNKAPVGGGAVSCPVWCNNTAWLLH